MSFYSVIVPIYNDACLAEDFCAEFSLTMKKHIGKENMKEDVELIFVNDGSRDDSMEVLKEIALKNNYVKVIDLSRNFGQHIAVSCGYKFAKGDYVGMLNVDMQDPPDQIPVLLEFMKKNNSDIVYGLREFRQSPLMDKWTSLLFNFLLNKLTGSETPYNAATIRVMNRRFTDAYNALSEKSRYLPGLQGWLGFKQGYTMTTHKKREKGKSSYNFKNRFLMALDAIISFSDIPLKMIAVAGMFVAFIGFLLSIYLVLAKFIFTIQPGYTSTISVIIFIGGIQIMVIGLSALYIGKILKEVQGRPLFIVKDKYNF